MATPNQVLSKELHVEPLKKNQVAVYKLIDSDKDDPAITDINGKRRKRTPGYMIAGRKKVYDPIAGKTVTIENVTTERTIDTPMGPVTRKRPQPIVFTSDKPAIAIRYDQPELYEFMERIPENRDNPFRGQSKVKPVFYRVDPRKKVMKENEVREFKLAAMTWIYKEATYTDLRACAKKLVEKYRPDVKIRYDYKDSEASLGMEMLKRELGAVAETDPQSIIKCSTKEDAIMRMQVKDAQHFQIIYFNPNDHQWIHNDRDLTPICTVDPLKNKEDELLKFFASDKKGGSHYVKMVETLKAFLTPQQ